MPFARPSSRASTASSGVSVSARTRRAARSSAFWRLPHTRALRTAAPSGVPPATACCTPASACRSSESCHTASVTASPDDSSAVEDAQRARGVAGEPRLGQLEDVVARDVGDHALHRLAHRACRPAAAARASRSPGARRAGCLRTARRGMRACRGSPAGPARARRAAIQRGSASRSTGSTAMVAPARSSAANHADALRRAIEPRQRDQRDVVRARRGGVALERLRALDAGLARRDAQVDQLAIAEEAHVGVRAEERVPVEVALGDEHLALGAAGLARRGANRVAGFERQQRLVAVHDVERRRRRARGARGRSSTRSCAMRMRARAASGRLARGLQPAHDLLHGVRLHLAQQALLLRVARQHLASR